MDRKWRDRCWVVVICSLLLLGTTGFMAYAQVPKRMNYQGYLTDSGGTPVNGTVSMTFSLYAAASGGTALWWETHSVTVTDGVYTVILGKTTPLVPSHFVDPLYLGVKVGSDSEMTPRQQVTSVGFAVNADKVDGQDASAFASSSHSHSFSQIAGTATDAQVPNDITVNYSTSAGNADTVDGQHASAFAATSHTHDTRYYTETELNTSGAGGHVHWNNLTGVPTGFADGVDDVSPGGTGDITAVIASTGLTGTTYSGDATLSVRVPLDLSGDPVVITPPYPYTITHVPVIEAENTGSSNTGSLATPDYGVIGYSPSGVGVGGGSGSSYGVRGVSNSSNGVRAESTSSTAVYALTKGGDVWQNAVYAKNEGLGSGVYGWSQNENGVFGVTYSSSHAAVHGENWTGGGKGVYGQATGVGWGVHGKATGTSGYGVYGEATAQNAFGGYFNASANNSVGNSWGVYAQALGTGGIGIEAQGALDGSGYAAVFNGRAKCDVLEITGADLSEEYGIRGLTRYASPSPGMVVSIDPDHPGGLIVSHSAYDRKVAGIISGAGGIQIGLVMGKAKPAENAKQPVALTGRVYCRADASKGAIAPGDLLTTSNTPGHAMKVLDYERAQGAILGKAMSSLDSGTGMVLVLVTLQ